MYGYTFAELMILLVVLFSGAWGSAFLAASLKRFSRKIDQGTLGPGFDDLRGDTHLLEARLGRVEEELRFFRQLQEPATAVRSGALESGDRDL